MQILSTPCIVAYLKPHFTSYTWTHSTYMHVAVHTPVCQLPVLRYRVSQSYLSRCGSCVCAF